MVSAVLIAVAGLGTQVPAKADTATFKATTSAGTGPGGSDTPDGGGGPNSPDLSLGDFGSVEITPDASADSPVSPLDAIDSDPASAAVAAAAADSTSRMGLSCNNSRVTPETKKDHPGKKVGDGAVNWYGAGRDMIAYWGLKGALAGRPTGQMATCLSKYQISDTEKNYNYYAAVLTTNWHYNLKGDPAKRALAQLVIKSSIKGTNHEATETYISKTQCGQQVDISAGIGGVSIGVPVQICKDYKLERLSADNSGATWEMRHIGMATTTSLVYVQRVKAGKVPKFTTTTKFPYHTVAEQPNGNWKWTLKTLNWPIVL